MPVPRGEIELRSKTGAALDARIVDLGAGGAGLVASAGQHGLRAKTSLLFCPGDASPFLSEVAPVHTTAPDRNSLVRVGVRFEGLAPPALGSLARLVVKSWAASPTRSTLWNDGREIRIRDPERILHALKVGLVDPRLLLAVSCASNELPVALRAVGLASAGATQGIRVQIEGTPVISLLPGVRYEFGFAGTLALHRFVSTILPLRQPGQLLVPLPLELVKSGFRESLRVALGAEISVAALHPRLPGQCLQKTIVNASAQGLAFLVDPSRDALFPEDSLILEFDDGRFWTEAVVRSFARTEHPGSYLCGLEIVRWPTRVDAERWKQFVFTRAHPDVELGHGATANQAWELLETSRYVDEANRELHEVLRTSFKDAWRTTRVHGRFDRFLLVRSGDRAVGIACASLVYPGTWLLHHGGVEQAARKADRQTKYQACYDIYGGIAKLVQEMDGFQHVITYVDAQKPFNHLVFTRFLEDYPFPEEFVFDEVDIFKGLPDTMPVEEQPEDLPDGVAVVPGNPRLHALLCEYLREHLKPVQFDALCLEPDRILLEHADSGALARKTIRCRRSFFATRGAEPLAAMLVEIGGHGVNIFNLLNVCWFVPLRPASRGSWPLKRALLRHAVRCYREHGVLELLYLEKHPSDEAEHLAGLGFAPPIAGLRWIARRQVLPAWIDHLNDLFRGMAEEITFVAIS